MTASFETPPGFVLKNDLLKAADDLGYRIDEGQHGAWHKRASTTARGSIHLAGEGRDGPWFLALENKAIVAELNFACAGLTDIGHAYFRFKTLEALRVGINRSYKLGVSLPNAPLDAYLKAIEGKPQNTEVERLVVQRIGQAQFRKALLDYWDGSCCVTGIRDTDLLRASHIKPWARCESDAERLDVHNGLLLSALWDAAFDKGLVTFDNNMKAVFSSSLTEKAKSALEGMATLTLESGTPKHADYLKWHRDNLFIKS